MVVYRCQTCRRRFPAMGVSRAQSEPTMPCPRCGGSARRCGHADGCRYCGGILRADGLCYGCGRQGAALRA